MNILITGSTGLLGSAFVEALQESKHTLFTPTRNELNITNTQKVSSFFKEHTGDNVIDLIIHCAAYTAVDQAESDKEDCNATNIEGLKNILQTNLPVIHFSTDYVFDASSEKYPEGIPEDTDRSPINVYAESKMAAEQLLEQSDNPWWNIRTSWLYGANGKNFIDIMQALFESKDSINVVSDQIGRLTYDIDLVESVIENFIENRPPSGHYHLQNSGKPTSWADVAEYVKTKTGGKTIINPIPSNQYPTPAKRPKYSVLQNTKLPPMPDWQESLDTYLGERTG